MSQTSEKIYSEESCLVDTQNHDMAIFGESFSDSGNLRDLEGLETFAKKFPQATNGAITNGRVWIEDLAIELKKRYYLGGYSRAIPITQPEVFNPLLASPQINNLLLSTPSALIANLLTRPCFLRSPLPSKKVKLLTTATTTAPAISSACKKQPSQLIKTCKDVNSSVNSNVNVNVNVKSRLTISHDAKSQVKSKDDNNNGFIINYAIGGAVIDPTNTTVDYKTLAFQVDKFVQDYTYQVYPYSYIYSNDNGNVSSSVSGSSSSNSSSNSNNKKKHCPKKPKPNLDIVFLIGANDLFNLVPNFTVWIQGFENVCNITNVEIDAQFGADFKIILDNYQAQWTKVAQIITPGNGLVKSCDDVVNKNLRFHVSNVQDITLSYYFQQILILAGITGEPSSICPTTAVNLTSASQVFQQVLKYYTGLLRARIDNWNEVNNYPFMSLLDAFRITQLVNNNRERFGIDIDAQHPVWLAQNLQDFTDFKFNPYFKLNPGGRGVILWDNIHPSKNAHQGFNYYVEPILTNVGRFEPASKTDNNVKIVEKECKKHNITSK